MCRIFDFVVKITYSWKIGFRETSSALTAYYSYEPLGRVLYESIVITTIPGKGPEQARRGPGTSGGRPLKTQKFIIFDPSAKVIRLLFLLVSFVPGIAGIKTSMFTSKSYREKYAEGPK